MSTRTIPHLRPGLVLHVLLLATLLLPMSHSLAQEPPSSESPPRDSAGERVTFRFAPPVPTTFTRAYEAEVEYHLAEGIVLKQHRVFSFELELSSRDDGLVLKRSARDLRVVQDGEEVSDPVLDLDKELTISLLLDEEGQLRTVEGYEGYAEKLKKSVSPEVFEVMTAKGDVMKDIVQAERDTWREMRGYYVGRSLAVGESVSLVVPRRNAVGTTLDYLTTCTLEETAQRRGRLLVRVSCNMATSESLFRESFDKEFSGSPPPKARETSVWHVAIWNTKWLDPATGLIYEEESTRLTLGDDSTGVAKSLETRSYEIHYDE